MRPIQPTKPDMQEVVIEKTFCTTREAADRLGVSVGTVQLWVESGLLQAWKTAGGHRRVMRESVDRLLHKKPAIGPGESAPPAAAVTTRRLSVLVVEDDANLLRLYEANISRWPMAPEVVVINNAVAALMLMGRKAPDFLVTDLHMPGMDGFNMLRVLNASPEMLSTTIVVVTGLDAAEIAQRGGLPAEIEVLPKPISFPRLLTIATGIVKKNIVHRPAP
jgi:excisionase family DNA binding protein